MTAPPPPTAASFPPRLVEVLADLSCVAFRREMDPDGAIRYPWMSDNVREIFGLGPGEMTISSTGTLNAIHWADRDAQVGAIRHSASTLSRCREAFRAITAGGETRWFRGSSSPVACADGTVVWDGAWVDVSRWMRAEHQHQTVMDHAEDCILTVDAGTGINWVNAAAERLFGWGADAMRGRCLSELLAAACPTEPPRRMAHCSVGDMVRCFPRGTQEVMARRRDGGVFPFEMTVSEIRSDGHLSLIVIGRDITRRRATEQKLEETEHRLRSIAANLPGIVFQRVRGPDGALAYPYVSEGIAEILGCDPSAVVTDPAALFDTMPADDRDRLLASLRASAETLEPVREDVRVTGRDGRIRWLRGQSRPRRRDDAVVWDGLALDVTEEVEERRRAEAAIRASEERFRLAFAAASLGIVVARLDGTIQQVNPAFQAMCGVDDEDLTGASVHRFIDPALLPAGDRLPATGDPFCFVSEARLPGGDDRHWHVTGTHFSASRDDPHPSLLFLIEDVTEVTRAAEERRQLELALQEGHKLEALGRLAGGVAHELNNMLGPILMAAEMVSRTATLDARNNDRIDRVIEAAKHGRDIVRNVLSYCRKEQKTLAAIDLVPLFMQFADLAASILPPTVRVETRVGPDAAPVTGDAGQITQVLLNLVNNARDAMDGRGTLLLALDLLPPEAPRRRGGPRNRPNPLKGLDPAQVHVQVTVADSGHGMAPGTMARIFDPFFTTKPVGEGTGLGLSVVQGIVKAMGGVVMVDSTPGEGTEVRIVLPVLPPEANPAITT